MVSNKAAQTFLSAVVQVIEFYKSYGHSVKTIRCDAGSNENESSVVEHLLDSWTSTPKPSRTRCTDAH
jgi:hypothetical protein